MTTPAPGIDQEIARHMRAYYHLSIQVSVATSLIAIYAVNELRTLEGSQLLFAVLLIGGHLSNLFSPPGPGKAVGAVITIAAAVGSALFDQGAGLVGVAGGILSGGITLAAMYFDSRSGLSTFVQRYLALSSVYKMSEVLEQLEWNRGFHLDLSLNDRIRWVERERNLSYSKSTGLFRQEFKVQVTWKESLRDGEVVITKGEGGDNLLDLELKAIDAALKHEIAMFDYHRRLMDKAKLPIELAQWAVEETPTLVDKYRNPAKYIDARGGEIREGDDIVERTLNLGEDWPNRPTDPDEPLQFALIVLRGAEKNRDKILKAKAKGEQLWKDWELKIAKVTSDAPGNADVQTVLQHINSVLGIRPLLNRLPPAP